MEVDISVAYFKDPRHLPQDLHHERSEILLPPQWYALGLGLLGIENRFFAIVGNGFMKKNQF